jgi:hypothetical protein
MRKKDGSTVAPCYLLTGLLITGPLFLIAVVSKMLFSALLVR